MNAVMEMVQESLSKRADVYESQRKAAEEKQRAALEEYRRKMNRPFTPSFGDVLVHNNMQYILQEAGEYGSVPMWDAEFGDGESLHISHFQGYTRQYYNAHDDYAEWISRVPEVGDLLDDIGSIESLDYDDWYFKDLVQVGVLSNGRAMWKFK